MNEFVKKGEPILREICLDRAGHKCELCDSEFMLDCHHILAKSIYPQYRLEPMNIIVVCRMKCHCLAENQAEEFLEQVGEKSKLQDRLIWATLLRGIDMNPTDADYEGQYNKLMEWNDDIFGV